MPKIVLCPPWRNMICTDCRDRGLPYEFYQHLWGTEDDHVCPPLSKEEIKAVIKDVLIETGGTR